MVVLPAIAAPVQAAKDTPNASYSYGKTVLLSVAT
ncbi:MAG: hypothetical protein LDLANPLL_02056 [Turneriella sp.]|nr:hypothetical protein [Turneriella sp.]